MIARRPLVVILLRVGTAAITAAAGVAIVSGCVAVAGAPGPTKRDSANVTTQRDDGARVGDRSRPPTPSALESMDVPVHLSAVALDALPEARFDSVIGGLLGETTATSQPPIRTFRLTGRTALYGADRTTPIGSLSATDFLGEPTVIVPVAVESGWARVLTPARQSLPSTNGGHAPAQTSGWIDADFLTGGARLRHRIVISVSASTLTVIIGGSEVATYPVGVGTEATPTPTGVTGYLQARYLDPSQNQAVHRVQLTSLHSDSVDEPYGGNDGGLIGLHFSDVTIGAVSHGCIRLDAVAITAVDALPLGTPITIEP